jgi:hypothetical protein
MTLVQHILRCMLITCMQSIDNIFVAWRPDVSSVGVLVARTLPFNTKMYPTGEMRSAPVDTLQK